MNFKQSLLNRFLTVVCIGFTLLSCSKHRVPSAYTSLYISTPASLPHELKEYEAIIASATLDEKTLAYVKKLYTLLKRNSDAPWSAIRVDMVGKIVPPSPCPTPPSPKGEGQCYPITGIDRLSYFTSPLSDPVTVLKKGEPFASATEDGYDQALHIRTVGFKGNLSVQKGDVLTFNIPVEHDGKKGTLSFDVTY